MKSVAALTVLGVRGSFPAADGEFLGYGGNTSCFLADLGGESVILDAGSGLAALGGAVALPGGRKHVHMLLSHLHLDHIMGLFCCPLLYDPTVQVDLYGQTYGGTALRALLDAVLRPPYWPLGLDDFPACVQVRELEPGTRQRLGDGLVVSTLRGNHPGGGLLYRLEGDGKALVYALDCEMDQKTRDALTRFSQGADLLIWDATSPPGP